MRIFTSFGYEKDCSTKLLIRGENISELQNNHLMIAWHVAVIASFEATYVDSREPFLLIPGLIRGFLIFEIPAKMHKLKQNFSILVLRSVVLICCVRTWNLHQSKHLKKMMTCQCWFTGITTWGNEGIIYG